MYRIRPDGNDHEGTKGNTKELKGEQNGQFRLGSDAARFVPSWFAFQTPANDNAHEPSDHLATHPRSRRPNVCGAAGSVGAAQRAAFSIIRSTAGLWYVGYVSCPGRR
jgi:hypothetical protein